MHRARMDFFLPEEACHKLHKLLSPLTTSASMASISSLASLTGSHESGSSGNLPATAEGEKGEHTAGGAPTQDVGDAVGTAQERSVSPSSLVTKEAKCLIQ